MATDLKEGQSLTLNFSPGMILVIKSNNLGYLPRFPDGRTSNLELYNRNDDILLNISLVPGSNKVIINDRAVKSIGDGWGEEISLDMKPADVKKWSSGVTISIHYCSTHSSERYQILFNLNTVCIFDKRLPGQAVKMAYRETSIQQQPGQWLVRDTPVLSNPLKVVCWNLDDLPLAERQAIRSGRVPSAIPAPSSRKISLPSSHFVLNQPCACISWDEGKEMRIYHLGLGNVLHEYAHSMSRQRNSWHHGTLDVILDPTSSLAVIRRKTGIICIYYQDPTSDIIHILLQRDGTWGKAQTTNTRAVKGSGIAVAEYSEPNGVFHSRIYYQDSQLCLRELVYNPSTLQWLPGDFNPGVQPRGTPITAEGVHGGAMDINVIWRDAYGGVVSSGWSKRSGWSVSNGGTEPLDGRD